MDGDSFEFIDTRTRETEVDIIDDSMDWIVPGIVEDPDRLQDGHHGEWIILQSMSSPIQFITIVDPPEENTAVTIEWVALTAG